MVDPKEKFTTEDRAQLSREAFNSNLSSEHLERSIAEELRADLTHGAKSSGEPTDFDFDQEWDSDAHYKAADKAELRDPDVEHFSAPTPEPESDETT